MNYDVILFYSENVNGEIVDNKVLTELEREGKTKI